MKLQKTIEKMYLGTNNSIKKNVLTWLEGEEVETVSDAVNLLENVRCENADVGHLVYYVDCGAWVYENEASVLELLNELTTSEIFDINDISWEQHNELSCEIFNWESGDDRMTRFNEEHRDDAQKIAEDETENWDSLDELEKDEAVHEVLNDFFYQEDPFELDKQDKVSIAWFAFEQTAWRLAEELEGE